MRKKQPTIKDKTIKVNGIKISYSEAGEGEPLILIHGDKYFWKTFIPNLAKDNLRLLTIHPPGWGDLQSLESINTLEKFSNLLDEIFVKLDLNSFNLAGQSLGSIIALLYASQHPEKVKRLLLLSPPFSVLGRKRGELFKKFLEYSLQSKTILKLNSYLHKTRFINYWACRIGGFYKFDRKIFEELILPSAQVCNEKIAMANTLSMLKINHLPLLAKVKSPKAIIMGGRDPVISIKKAKKISQDFPNFHLFIIPFAKHAIMLEKPKELSKIMLDFLSS